MANTLGPDETCFSITISAISCLVPPVTECHITYFKLHFQVIKCFKFED